PEGPGIGPGDGRRHHEVVGDFQHPCLPAVLVLTCSTLRIGDYTPLGASPQAPRSQAGHCTKNLLTTMESWVRNGGTPQPGWLLHTSTASFPGLSLGSPRSSVACGAGLEPGAPRSMSDSPACADEHGAMANCCTRNHYMNLSAL